MPLVAMHFRPASRVITRGDVQHPLLALLRRCRDLIGAFLDQLVASRLQRLDLGAELCEGRDPLAQCRHLGVGLLQLSGATGDVLVDGLDDRGGFRGAVADLLEVRGLGRGLLAGGREDLDMWCEVVIVVPVEVDRAELLRKDGEGAARTCL